MDQPFLCRKTYTGNEKTYRPGESYSLSAAPIHISNGGDSWLMKREKVSPEEWRERLTGLSTPNEVDGECCQGQ